MKRILRTLLLMAVVTFMVGCAGARSSLYFAVENPEGPGKTVVIQPLIVHDTIRGLYGNTTIKPAKYNAHISDCIAAEIKRQSPDANIVFSNTGESTESNVAVRIVDIRDFIFRQGWTQNGVIKFKADVVDAKGGKRTVEASAGSGILPYTGTAREAAEKACKDFVDQIKDLLQ